jgi:hypothetical protein
MAEERKQASFWEKLGAWLHLWTPPRDIEIPPVPWRNLLIFGLPVLAAAVVVVWLIADDASESNREREAAQRREREELRERRNQEVLRNQVPVRAGTSASSRPAQVSDLERFILEDAEDRVREGDLEQDVLRVACEPHPKGELRQRAERNPSARSGRYACLAVTSEVYGVGRGTIGYPFLARINYGSGTMVWCKVAGIPSELSLPDPRTLVNVPKACR